MNYAAKTFEDRNPVKRWFQKARLRDALRLARESPAPARVVDFGAGNGELCKLIAQRFPDAEIVCYEPHPELLVQAKANTAGIANVTFIADPGQLLPASVNLLFCLEVFEHLPKQESGRAWKQIDSALADDGVAIIGVPIETGLPALYKGLFRIIRRYGEFDARFGNILSAIFGRPPSGRPVVELMPGSWYHLHHLGFDHRRFRDSLLRRFDVTGFATGPLPLVGAAVNSEATYAVKKAVRGPA